MALKISLVGHIVVDTVVRGGEVRRGLGGTVVYGALAARMHGAEPRIISKVGLDFPDEYLIFLSRSGVDISGIKVSRSKGTTRFKLVYTESGRKLYLMSRCEDITPLDVDPEVVREGPVVIGSVAWEVTPELAKMLSRETPLVAFELQGYLRDVNERREVVRRVREELADVIREANVVHADLDEARTILGDVKPEEAALKLRELGPSITLITLADKGAYVGYEGGVLYVPPPKVREVVDPTGCGDVFLTVFTVEYGKYEDIEEAAAFASAAAGFLIEKPGISGLRSRWEVKRRAEEILQGIEKRR